MHYDRATGNRYAILAMIKDDRGYITINLWGDGKSSMPIDDSLRSPSNLYTTNNTNTYTNTTSSSPSYFYDNISNVLTS